jgi:hypothetical protein
MHGFTQSALHGLNLKGGEGPCFVQTEGTLTPGFNAQGMVLILVQDPRLTVGCAVLVWGLLNWKSLKRAKSVRLMVLSPYINMVLRIKPTAKPSISKASPGSTTMVW